uniref:Uncharacterized protein n=1 Tax=Rhizophora mucronata TaxID=61149 RepID=A0A2P2QDW1_RHIMU
MLNPPATTTIPQSLLCGPKITPNSVKIALIQIP